MFDYQKMINPIPLSVHFSDLYICGLCQTVNKFMFGIYEMKYFPCKTYL